jgi:hypothetical protein
MDRKEFSPRRHSRKLMELLCCAIASEAGVVYRRPVCVRDYLIIESSILVKFYALAF